jgi:HK97 family phage prohead protease
MPVASTNKTPYLSYEARATLARLADRQAAVRKELEKLRADQARWDAARAREAAQTKAAVVAEVAKFEALCRKYPLPARLRAVSAPPARVSAKSLGTAGRAGGLEHKSLPFAIKASSSGGAASFSGYGASYNNIDAVGDIIVPGAFAEDLPAFLADGFIGGLGHNWDQPVARVKSAREDARGLLIESGPIVDTTHGVDVAKLLRAGIVRKLSIGYRAINPRLVSDPSEVEAYWKSVNYFPTATDRQRARDGVRLLTRVELLEVSPVAVAANARADITGVKSSSASRPAPAMSR